MDQFTETTTTSWGDRIKSAFAGLILGPIIVIASIYFLWENEQRAVSVENGLNQGAKQVVTISADSVDSSNANKLVYISGNVQSEGTLTDSEFSITRKALKFQRKVEMYQWEENSKTETVDNMGGSQTSKTTYSYKTVWSDTAIDSSSFHGTGSGKVNPTDWKYSSQEHTVKGVRVGAYEISPKLLESLQEYTPVVLSGAVTNGSTSANTKPGSLNTSAATAVASETTAPTTINSSTTEDDPAVVDSQSGANIAGGASEMSASGKTTRTLIQKGNTLFYAVNPDVPQIGDLRITFQEIAPTVISAVGKLEQSSSNSGSTQASIVPYVSDPDLTIALISGGKVSPSDLFQKAKDENSFMTWVIRGIALVFMLIGFSMFMSIIPVLGAFLPIFSDILEAGTGLIALAATIIVGGGTIALAWFYARPVYGVLLLVVIGGIVWFFKNRLQK